MLKAVCVSGGSSATTSTTSSIASWKYLLIGVPVAVSLLDSEQLLKLMVMMVLDLLRVFIHYQ